MDKRLITEDFQAIVALASGSHSLAKTPQKDNWVDHDTKGLPRYIRKVARGIRRTGKTTSQAIAIAISRMRVWARGGQNVNKDTQAKAAKALAEWEALKARNKSRTAAKKVKLTSPKGDAIIALSDVSSYSFNEVEAAWYAQNREYPEPEEEGEYTEQEYQAPPNFYLYEVWSDYIVVRDSDGEDYYKVPYIVDTVAGVAFQEPTPIRRVWEDIDEDEDFDENELELLSDILDAETED